MNMLDSYTVRVLHQDRLREAERRRKYRMLRNATEQNPVVAKVGLVQTIKQWLRFRSRQGQEARDARRATAV